MTHYRPLVSIITITYNAAATLERTIESIERQDYDRIEYIVIDGASTDGTLQIIQRHMSGISYMISERDSGLYDAMNKGMAAATGDYLWFVNAGDEIFASDTVSRMMAAEPDADVYYGATVMTDMQGELIGRRRLAPPERLTWRSFSRGMLVSHQSFVARRTLCRPYDTAFRFSADYGWCLDILRRSQRICNTHLTLSRFLDGGITKQNIVPGLRERFVIMKRNFGLMPTLAAHVPIACRFFAFWLTKGRF